MARFTPTVRGVARRHRLGDADRDEVIPQTWMEVLTGATLTARPRCSAAGAPGGWGRLSVWTKSRALARP